MHGERRMLKIFEDCVDMALNLTVFLSSYFILSAHYALDVALSHSLYISLFIGVIICSLIYRLFDLNRPLPHIAIRKTYVFRLLCADGVFFGGAIVMAIFIFDGEALSFCLKLTALSAVISFCIILARRQVTLGIMRLVRRKEICKIVLVGDNPETAAAFVRRINDAGEGLMLVGAVGERLKENTGCEWLGDVSSFEKILDREHPSYAVFAVESYKKRTLTQLVNLCDDRCVKVYFLPVIYGFFKSPRQIEYMGTLPLINIHSTPLDITQNAFIKRVFDVVGSLILIILTAPVMLFTAVGVRLSSPGPILFKQERVGRLGRRFTMLKFRSMRVNDTSDTEWSRGIDARKTKFGNFIRRTSIDELPQFFNVLSGDMSLVGPRPEIPHFVERFKEEIPLYMVKHYVKPGVTGLAQIRGLRGDTSVEERIEADLCYIEGWSLWLDIKILLATPFKAINKSEKYIEKETPGGEK